MNLTLYIHGLEVPITNVAQNSTIDSNPLSIQCWKKSIFQISQIACMESQSLTGFFQRVFKNTQPFSQT